MTDADVIERGMRARELLEYRTFLQFAQEVMDAERDLIANSPPEDTRGRELAYFRQWGVLQMFRTLEAWKQQGTMLQEVLEGERKEMLHA